MILPETAQFYEFGPFRIDGRERLLLHEGQVVPLTPKVFDTLLVLVENSGHILTKEKLMNLIWQETAVEEANLTRNISVLRRALGESADQNRYIETIPWRGYRFVASVREVREELADLVVEECSSSRVVIEQETDTSVAQADRTPLIARSFASEEQIITPGRRLLRQRVVAGLTLLIALAVGSLVGYRYVARSAETKSSPISSVAVLPLKNLTGDPAQDYFSDGVTESLITALSRVEGLKVISRGAVFPFKGGEVDPREVGEQLGVAAVLEGSTRNTTDSVRVAVRLVSTDDGCVLWTSDAKDRARGDIFALQDDIARSVVEGLRVALGEKEERQLVKRYTDNVEAHLLYLKGRYSVHQLYTEDQIKKGIEYYNKAIELDPNYAMAYAGLADAYYGLSNIYLHPREAMPSARDAALKALQLDDTLVEPHISLGLVKMFYEWDFSGAQSEFERAVGLNPNDAMVRNWYSFYLAAMGRFDEAIAEIRRAEELEPWSLKMKRDVGWILYLAREYDQAIDQLRKTLETDPNDTGSVSLLGRTYVMKSRFPEAIAQLQKAVIMEDSPFRLGYLGYAYAVLGNKKEARKIILKLERQSTQRHVPPHCAALIYTGLREPDQVFELLEKEYKERNESLVWLKVEPLLDSLRSDPRFADFVRRVGFAS